jgi:hypothetical protein
MSSLLALNVDDRAICDFFVGLPVQRHPDRKVARLIASNDLNASHGLAPGPLLGRPADALRAGTLAAPSGNNALGAAARDRMPILAVVKCVLWVSR